MSEHLRQYVRYLNLAEALRAIAKDYDNEPAIHRSMMSLAEQYGRTAAALLKSAVRARQHSWSAHSFGDKTGTSDTPTRGF